MCVCVYIYIYTIYKYKHIRHALSIIRQVKWCFEHLFHGVFHNTYLIFITSIQGRQALFPHLLKKSWVIGQWMNCSQLVRGLVGILNEVCYKPHFCHHNRECLNFFQLKSMKCLLLCQLALWSMSWGSWKDYTVTWLSCCQNTLIEEILLFSPPEPVVVQSSRILSH